MGEAGFLLTFDDWLQQIHRFRRELIQDGKRPTHLVMHPRNEIALHHYFERRFQRGPVYWDHVIGLRVFGLQADFDPAMGHYGFRFEERV